MNRSAERDRPIIGRVGDNRCRDIFMNCQPDMTEFVKLRRTKLIDLGRLRGLFKESLLNLLLALPQQFDLGWCQHPWSGQGTELLIE